MAFLDENGLAELWSIIKPKVGDIRATARTDLGEKWALCNGAAVRASAYPELAALLGTTAKTDTFGSAFVAKDVYYGNGTWVVVGREYSTTASKNYPAIYYSTDPGNGWTYKKLSTSVPVELEGIAYNNGRWVAVGTHYSDYTPYAFTATSLGGTWTATRLSSSTYTYVYDVDCYNGTWVIAGCDDGQQYQGVPVIYTTTSPTGTWTQKYLSYENMYLRSVVCHEGTWVAAGYYSGAVYVFTTTNPSGSWTKTTVFDSGSSATKIVYLNNTWVITGSYGTTAGRWPSVFYATSPTGTWSQKTPTNQYIIALDQHVGIAYAEGTWRILTSSSGNVVYECCASDLGSTWTYSTLKSSSGRAGGIASDGTAYVQVYQTTDYKTNYACFNDVVLLPTLTDSTYHYIKIKE